jgi:integrase
LFYRYREWLVNKNYQPKTVYGALTICKQVFKWGHAEGHLKEYRLVNTKLAEAKAKPQPCFTTEQVETLILSTSGVEQAAIATLAYAGLRIGELEQLLWQDVRLNADGSGMFHVRLGGSNGTTKDKDARFVPVHPRIRPLLDALPRGGSCVFPKIAARQFLLRIKQLCQELRFPDHKAFKVHSFRHHFASLCANHHVAYRKALAWLGHSDSSILQLYYHLSDEDSQAAMTSLATKPSPQPLRHQADQVADVLPSNAEGVLKTIAGSKIGNELQVQIEQILTELPNFGTERGRFELP